MHGILEEFPCDSCRGPRNPLDEVNREFVLQHLGRKLQSISDFHSCCVRCLHLHCSLTHPSEDVAVHVVVQQREPENFEVDARHVQYFSVGDCNTVCIIFQERCSVDLGLSTDFAPSRRRTAHPDSKTRLHQRPVTKLRTDIVNGSVSSGGKVMRLETPLRADIQQALESPHRITKKTIHTTSRIHKKNAAPLTSSHPLCPSSRFSTKLNWHNSPLGTNIIQEMKQSNLGTVTEGFTRTRVFMLLSSNKSFYDSLSAAFSSQRFAFRPAQFFSL